MLHLPYLYVYVVSVYVLTGQEGFHLIQPLLKRDIREF